MTARLEERGAGVPEAVEIWVQGQRFEVRSELDRQLARDVARYVNEKIREAASRSGPVPRLNVVVLAVLDIARGHLELLREHRRVLQEVEEESRRLVGSIERVL